MAGPPTVSSGIAITKDRAQEILVRDLDAFSAAVKPAITAQLNDNQFSALVSFAYNVGPENFRRSSVLTALNAYDFAAVPVHLALWVKAGGKVLPGLVKRRAAEGALFLLPDETAASSALGIPDQQKPQTISAGSQAASSGQPVEPLLGNIFQQSNINIAAILSAIGGIVSSAARRLEEILGKYGSLWLEIAAISVVVLAAVWIVHKNKHHRGSSEQRHLV
jgi:lysozyme